MVQNSQISFERHPIRKNKGTPIKSLEQKFSTEIKKRILIVDDELFNQIAAKIVLKAAGIQNVDDLCDTAINGEDAVDMVIDDIKTNKTCSYSLILMDLNMPIMDGCKATSLIRQYLYEQEIN